MKMHSACSRCLPILAFFAPSISALANINLDFRPDSQTALIGDTVNVELYAVSDDATNQSLSAMDVILVWDPSKLQLLGASNAGNGYSWLNSGFLYPGGLNQTYSDGDAIWTAFAQFGDPAYATPQGLKVTTFQFRALEITTGTPVSISAARGGSKTVVYDGQSANKDVTGTLDQGAVVRILADVPVPPTSYSVFRGLYQAGTLASLFASDDQYLEVRNGPVALPSESPVTIVFDGTAPAGYPYSLRFILESRASISGLTQRIDLFDWTTNAYVQTDTRAASTSDQTVSIGATNPDNLVESGTNALRARLRVRADNPVFTNNWRALVDFVGWRIANQ